MMPRHKAGIAIGLFLGLFLSGCAGFPKVSWPQLPGEGIEPATVLDYYRKAGTLSPAKIDREIVRLRKDFNRKPDDNALFQLVALASQPGRPPVDRKLALDLLIDFRRQDKGGATLLSLTSLLEDQLKEQLELVGERDQVLQRARKLETDNSELQDKLQALEDIEKILRQREK